MDNKEKWVYTHCGGCYGCCAMRVKVVDGVMVKIEGVPDSDFGPRGGLCGKGLAALMDYYDPNRCNYPVRRTNPKKGLYEDPKWQKISWDEALDTITEKLKKIKATDPRKLAWAHTPMYGTAGISSTMVAGFFITYGSRNRVNGGTGVHCGAVSHEGAGLFHASWSVVPDYRYCNYAIQFGTNKGTGSGHSAGITMRQAAEARARGMRNIVFDPICNFAGGKATEWYPILPATDSAVILSMCNLILNEFGIYDAEYIRSKTNGPYLVGPDKKFVRDRKSGKPFLWDEKDGVARIYDDPGTSCPSIEGEHVIDGIRCVPAFQLIKEHLKSYTPAWASAISTVPANVIRRIAREFAEEAKIGSTIEIEGVRLPYRPVSAIMYKGGQGHQNAFSQYMSVMLLNALVGNQEAVGGTVSWPARSLGFPETNRPRFEPHADRDGYISAGMWYGLPPWPAHAGQKPQLVHLCDLFPHAHSSPYPYTEDFDELWDKLGHPYDIEALGIYGGNVVKNLANPETAARFLEKIPFIFSINTAHNETTEGFADIVLPDCHFLESCNVLGSMTYFFNFPMGRDNWGFHCLKPVIEPKYERREALDTFFELADRLGFRAAYNNFLDNYTSMKLAKWAVDVADNTIIGANEKISCRQTTDRVLKFLFGQERGLEWFQEHGFITWKKKPEETYWRWFIDARVPIYFEFLEHERDTVDEIATKAGMKLQMERYEGTLSYYPSVLYAEAGRSAELDMIAVSFKDILHTGSFTAENPWLDEMSATNPYTYNITINLETANRKGLKDGDTVCLENSVGDKITGRLKLMKGIHPQVVAMVGHLGSWARGKPVARGKGVNSNTLLRLGLKDVCPISLAPETATKVKIYKVGGGVK